jgi:hypothetical protein
MADLFVQDYSSDIFSNISEDPQPGQATPADDTFMAGIRDVPEDSRDQDFMNIFELAFQREVLDNSEFPRARSRMNYDDYTLIKRLLYTTNDDFARWPTQEKTQHVRNMRVKAKDYEFYGTQLFRKSISKTANEPALPPR